MWKAKFEQKPARAPQFFYPQRPHAKDNNLKAKEKPVRNTGIPLRTASKPPGSTRKAPTPRATFVRQQPRYAARQAGAGSDKVALVEAMARGEAVAPAPAPSHLDEKGAIKIPEKWDHVLRGALKDVAASDAAEDAAAKE
jgi:hypothetical protein